MTDVCVKICRKRPPFFNFGGPKPGLTSLTMIGRRNLSSRRINKTNATLRYINGGNKLAAIYFGAMLNLPFRHNAPRRYYFVDKLCNNNFPKPPLFKMMNFIETRMSARGYYRLLSSPSCTKT